MSSFPPPTEQGSEVDEGQPQAQDRALLGVGSGDGQAVQHFMRLGRKYLWLILTCVALGLGLGFLRNATSPKLYTSSTDIEITQDTADQFRLGTMSYDDGGYIDVSRLDTEVAILKSRTLALQTIKSLHLNTNPNFLPPKSTHHWNLDNNQDRNALVGMFLAGLTAGRYQHTNMLQLSCTSRNPDLSARMCNTLIDNYVQHNFSDNYAATQEVSVWLQAQLGDLKARLEKSQEKMLALQKDIGLVGVDQTHSILLARLVDIGHDLTQAESRRLIAQARLLTLESAPANVLPTLSNDPIMMAQKQRLTGLEANYASLHANYGPRSPQLASIQSEMTEIKRAMKLEQVNVIDRAREELKGATENENALRAKMDQEKNDAFKDNSKAVTYTLARREYEANRTLYDGLQERLQEAGIIAGLHSTDIRRIDPADPADAPSSPRKSMNLAFGLAAGLAIGLVLALVVESLDTNIKTIFDIEERLGLPMLGIVPQADAKLLSPEAFVNEATSAGAGAWSRLAESYRSLRTAILLSRAGTPPRVMIFSSSRPSEGKTSVASLEAVVFALNGARVLLIDSDLRRPTVHLRFRIPNQVGLTSVLTGKCSAEEAVVNLPSIPSLDILPAGPIAPMPAELLGSSQMRALVEGFRSHYDFILIDTPPILTVTDPAVMVPVSDGVVLVLRYGEASRNVAARASEVLLRSGAHLLGVVLNAVDLKSSDYSEYYGRAYNDYYQSRVDTEG